MMRIGRAAAAWERHRLQRRRVAARRRRAARARASRAAPIALSIYPWDIVTEMETRLESPQAMLLVVPNGKVKLLNALPFAPADLRRDSLEKAWHAYRDAWRSDEVRAFVGRCRVRARAAAARQRNVADAARSLTAHEDRLRRTAVRRVAPGTPRFTSTRSPNGCARAFPTPCRRTAADTSAKIRSAPRSRAATTPPRANDRGPSGSARRAPAERCRRSRKTSGPRSRDGGEWSAGRRRGAGRRVRSCTTRAEQHHDQLPHLPRHVVRGAREARFEQLLRILRHRRIGVGIRPIEVGARAHDAVEVVSELHVAAEHALVHRTVGGRVVREAHAPRPPVRARAACAASGRRRRSRAPSTAVPGPRGRRSVPRAARRRRRLPRSSSSKASLSRRP